MPHNAAGQAKLSQDLSLAMLDMKYLRMLVSSGVINMTSQSFKGILA
jgi:hypothetical protein